jgi:Predicted transcriptional regulators
VTAKAVAHRIREVGIQSPIIVESNGVIIAGHTRYKTASRLKSQEEPVIEAAERDPEKLKALRIADNSTGKVAE